MNTVQQMAARGVGVSGLCVGQEWQGGVGYMWGGVVVNQPA